MKQALSLLPVLQAQGYKVPVTCPGLHCQPMLEQDNVADIVATGCLRTIVTYAFPSSNIEFQQGVSTIESLTEV